MNKANISWNSRQLAKALTNGSLTSDNAMQRGIVWDRNRQSLLIESILKGYPIPAIYTVRTNEEAPAPAKKGSKIFDLLDGKQRTEAIRAYLNDEFELQGVSEVEGEDGQPFEIAGKKFSELPESMQDIINTFTFNVYYFSETSDEEIAEIMYRLNNGRTLTGMEQARIRAKDLNAIMDIAGHSLFRKNLTKKAMESYGNEDMIIKALLMLDEEYDLTAKNIKDGYTKYGREDIMKLSETLDRVEYIIDYVKVISKKVAKNIVKKTNLVGVIYFAYNHLRANQDNVSDFMYYFFGGNKSDIDENDGYWLFAESLVAYSEYLKNGTNRQTNVKGRIKAMEEAYSAWKEWDI